MSAKPEAPASAEYDPVRELAALVATALSDPMSFGMREGLKRSLGVGAGTSIALIELRIRVALASQRAVVYDLADVDTLHVLTQALEGYAANARHMAELDDGSEPLASDSFARWARLAKRLKRQAEAAAG